MLRLLLAGGVLPLMAPTCGSLAPGIKTFSRNSLVIPMDVCYQSQTDKVSTSGYAAVGCPGGTVGDPGDVVKAYGLIYQLVRKNIPVYWVIAQNKGSFTDVDMSIQYNGGPPVLKYDWTSNVVSSTAPTSGTKIEYRGGPFVIDGSDYAAALAVLNANKQTFSKVNVHVANVAFQGYVAKTMAGGWNAGGAVPPKLALLDIGSSDMPCSATRCSTAKNSELVIKGYLTAAGLDTAGASGPDPITGHGAIYDNLQMKDFLPDSGGSWTSTALYKNGYQVLWVPHWEAPGSCSDCPPSTSCTCLAKYDASDISKALKSIGAFSAAGNDVFAECAGVGSFEGVLNRTSYANGDPSTHFQTTTNPGLSDINRSVGKPKVWGSYSSPLMQIGDYPFKPDTGAIQNYKAGAYKTETVKLISNQDSSGNYDNYDIFTMVPPSSSHGSIVYLAGHSYSGGEPGAYDPFEIAGSRLVLNTLFNLGATCQQTGVACSTGLLGECSQGVMSCNDKGEPVCVAVKSPQPEICDGKDNDCNGVPDDGLDQVCYDGPADSLDPNTHQPQGICRAGKSFCVELSPGVYGMSACTGEVLPSSEICDGRDNDCDGHVGNVKGTTTPLSQSCYEGPGNTFDAEAGSYLGICKPGKSLCTNGKWGECTKCDDSTFPWRNPSAHPDCQILPHQQVCVGEDANYDMTCTGSYSCGCTSGATASCYDGPAATRGVGKCHEGTRTCSGGAWGGCANEVLPAARDCASAEDNDCNGLADNTEPVCTKVTCPPETSDVRICRATGAARYVTGDTIPAGKQVGDPKGMCKDGSRSCNTSDGTVGDCSGTIYPAPEICDGQDNNCDGQIDENPDTLCNTGFACENGVCVKASCGPESRCPEGYTCDDATSKCVLGKCGDDSATAVTCAAGQVCSFGQCADPCEGVKCAAGAVCARGATGGFCTGGGCYLQGCSSGQSCVQGQCEPDPCNGVACPVGTFCRAGDCVQSCVYVTCPADQICSADGFCVTDPCSGITCPAGKACVAGACQPDPCSGQGCGPRQICKVVDGAAVCQDDPCSVVTCPVGSCTNGQCYVAAARDSSQPTPISTSSGSSGGCGCGSGGGGGLGAALLLLLLPLLRRGRRPSRPGGGGRAALLGLAAVIALSASACKGGGSSSSTNLDYSTCTETCGENKCVDLNFDALHCGHCGTTCAAGEACEDGVCGPSTAVAPYIGSVSPGQANHGLLTPVTVVVTGERFQKDANLRAVFGKSSRTFATTWIDNNHLSAKIDLQDVPATELALRVVNPDHVISNAVPFDVVDVAPSLSSVTPGQVLAGAVTTLTVKGTGFAGTSTCQYDGGSLHNISMATKAIEVDGVPALECIFDGTPTGVTTGSYALRVLNGTAASNDLSFTVVSPVPTLASLSPSQGDAGAAVNVYVTGTGFDRTSGVYFQWGTAAPQLAMTQYVDAAHLMVLGYVLPSGGAQTAKVTVQTGSNVSNSLSFRAVISADSIQVMSLSVTPSPLYQGQTATLNFAGSNFGTVSGITVSAPNGGTANATVTSSSATSATGTIDLSKIANAQQGRYQAYVTFTDNSVSTDSSSFPFQVLSNVAAVQTVTPAAAKQGTSPTLSIWAANVLGTPKAVLTGQGVTINGTSVAQPSPTTDPTQWQAVFDLSGRNTGSYMLTLQNSGAAVSNQYAFTILPGQPTITSINPSCAVQSDTPVAITISGTNFALPDGFGNTLTQVMYSASSTSGFQLIPATVKVNSASSITATFDTRNAPADSTYYIQVWNPKDPSTGTDQHSSSATFRIATSSCS